MNNKSIKALFQTYITLLELHGANSFKIRGYQNLVLTLDKVEENLSSITFEALQKIDGISKSAAEKISAIIQTGTFDDLQKHLEITPTGVLEISRIKGLGAKKVLTLWKDLGIETKEALKEACEAGKVAALKGFGAKTQQKILDAIAFEEAQKGKFLLIEIEDFAEHFKDSLRIWLDTSFVDIVGQYIRKLPVIEKLELIISGYNYDDLLEILNKNLAFTLIEDQSQPKTLKIQLNSPQINVYLHLSTPNNYIKDKLILSSGSGHLQHRIDSKSIKTLALSTKFKTEEEFYKSINLPFVSPEVREGYAEFKEGFDPKTLITDQHLRGILHNHSTYSDGKNTLREMAEYCMELGYEYLGISDHSVSAFYASGLDADRILQQHAEIEQINKDLAPFKVFKGIESDILNNGSLDYPEEVLKSFDFIVSSIHSNLNMDINKASKRLITAIENPYTTILGHMTGRLLLRRDGYPIDHKKVIDACAANKAVIEINANPWRIDIDWTWIDYALNKGVMLSINPDAHETHGYHHMKYGIYAGRKGGLTADMCLNAMSREEIEKYFSEKK